MVLWACRSPSAQLHFVRFQMAMSEHTVRAISDVARLHKATLQTLCLDFAFREWWGDHKFSFSESVALRHLQLRLCIRHVSTCERLLRSFPASNTLEDVSLVFRIEAYTNKDTHFDVAFAPITTLRGAFTEEKLPHLKRLQIRCETVGAPSSDPPFERDRLLRDVRLSVCDMR
ncbi:hypothetical protein PsYK624_157600 [Phanerochaete sordida]|uniref:Uncharacterized protein n=1 Tax=Phanerochaete sordida TaxID=48140 RepID=A0A9P3GRG9_9APHY|nr:hypothetical protein PsYK624_157600 [Phanerochaete sordida]